jgi:hypothetical protein
MQNTEQLENILKIGENKARKIAQDKLKAVRSVLGFE